MKARVIKERRRLEQRASALAHRKMQQAWHAGERAYDRRQGLNMNPFSAETQPHFYEAWLQGFKHRAEEATGQSDKDASQEPPAAEAGNQEEEVS